LALPLLIPLIVAKAVATTSVTVSVVGLGGMAYKEKMASDRKKTLKERFSDFFKLRETKKKEPKEDAFKKTF